MNKDIIYREDAIGACAYETLECYEARKTIRTLPPADRPQEWIPCEERLPSIGEVVLATWEYGCKRYVTIAYQVSLRGVTYWDSKQQHEYKPLNVIAWMPLPEPYKKDEENE